MTNLEKMWVAMSAYLPQAIAEGHGDSWARMCNEKTHEATSAACHTAKDSTAIMATWNAADSINYARMNNTINSDYWAQTAIDRITLVTVKSEQVET
jgi:hypothetical protein